jgi:hypothetical protein
MSFKSYTDERLITSRDALNRMEIKLKLLDIHEGAYDPIGYKFGHRMLVRKVLAVIRYTRTDEVEEKELDLEAIEKEMKTKRIFSSSNRWLYSTDVKNGYIVASKHFDLLADAIALDYVVI